MKQLELFGESTEVYGRRPYRRTYTAVGGPYDGQDIRLTWAGPRTATVWFSVDGGEAGRYVTHGPLAKWEVKK